ncbi:hypothetical protein ACJMK2_025873 [Sinanodonta woodiana]|uniref:Sulfite oxidase n=1 Tax=Sinanodonta woodiana TaxID=1069815 RepID=A0ABD3XJQ9_SINWO
MSYIHAGKWFHQERRFCQLTFHNIQNLSPAILGSATCVDRRQLCLVDNNCRRYSQGNGGHQREQSHWKWGLGLAGSLGVVGSILYWKISHQKLHAAEVEAGVLKTGLPTFSKTDVAKHKTAESRIWVTYRNGVYDVTDYVSEHPGGNKILLGAGTAIDPFWEMYGVHKQAEIFAVLEKYRIGNITEVEEVKETDKKDSYANDPKRHPALKPASEKPFNAEPPPSLLIYSYLTPNDLFFIRNHLPVPVVDPKTFSLQVAVEKENEGVKLSLDDLKSKFPKKSVTTTIQCSGNRRSEMIKIKSVKGLNWGNAAISTAEWSGVTLDTILKHSGIDIDKADCKHVQFEGMDKGPDGATYGASIPIEIARCLKNEIIVAYAMNGTDIPRDHGYPLRIIIPGIVGARQVKWLNKIVLSNEESSSHWQQRDYKGFNSSTDWHNVDFSKAHAIQELPVVSAICEPAEGQMLDDAEVVTVKGYAWSGGGRGIYRVDVSADGGKTWHEADLNTNNQSPFKAWAWTLWEATVPLPKESKNTLLICKAIDSSYNCQPDSVEGIWNLRGVLSNAWHRVSVTIPDEQR